MYNSKSAFRKTRTLATQISLLTAVSLLGACITVNVNFPEGAVQKAADDYVRELYKSKQKGKEDKEEIKAAEKPKGARLEWGITSALADGVAINMSTPKTKEIQARQVERLDEISGFKKEGLIGEGFSGMLILKSAPGLSPLKQKKIEGLIKKENDDRKELYDEVLKANQFSSSRLLDVQKSFSKSFQDKSPSGTWIETAPNQWEKNP